MSNQAKFENEAQAITERYQVELDLKLYLSHWSGYKEVKSRHIQELQELAIKYEIDLKLKDWTLNDHWM